MTVAKQDCPPIPTVHPDPDILVVGSGLEPAPSSQIKPGLTGWGACGEEEYSALKILSSRRRRPRLGPFCPALPRAPGTQTCL